MKEFIVFKTPGEIDLNLALTFGVSDKTSDDSIGRFGTGLKYAIAICLRKGGDFIVYSGLDFYRFTTQERVGRSVSYQEVLVNNSSAHFSTHLGEHWEWWQGYRELESNTLDEDGETYFCNKAPKPEKGFTYIVLDDEDTIKAHLQRDSLFLRGQSICSTRCVEIHPPVSGGDSIFYRGIRVGESEKSGIYSYNLTTSTITLTEDRTLKYPSIDFNLLLAVEFCTLRDKDTLREVLTARVGSLEQGLSFYHTELLKGSPIYEMIEELGFAKITNQSLVSRYNELHTTLVPNKATLSSIQEQQLKKARKFCNKVFSVPLDIEVSISDNLGDALAMYYAGGIYISIECFKQGTSYVAHALWEEWVHKITGYKDETRELQNYLFKEAISLGERLEGSPL